MHSRRQTNHSPHHHESTWNVCNPNPDPVTAAAIDAALMRAGQLLEEGKLITPTEAFALGVAKDKETLFSIARTIAWATGGDQEDILCRLNERYPDFS